MNYFQPSFQLLSKKREGAKVRKTYRQPATPCARLLAHAAVPETAKAALRSQEAGLDPLELLHRIRDSQAALAALSTGKPGSGPGRESLEQFLAGLADLWRKGEARPTHRAAASSPRDWRTRKDPFEAVWPEILAWLQETPDATAKVLFARLEAAYPSTFTTGQWRTLQRRIRQWRHVLARKLVYSGSAGKAENIGPIGTANAPQATASDLSH